MYAKILLKKKFLTKMIKSMISTNFNIILKNIGIVLILLLFNPFYHYAKVTKRLKLTSNLNFVIVCLLRNIAQLYLQKYLNTIQKQGRNNLCSGLKKNQITRRVVILDIAKNNFKKTAKSQIFEILILVGSDFGFYFEETSECKYWKNNKNAINVPYEVEFVKKIKEHKANKITDRHFIHLYLNIPDNFAECVEKKKN